MSLPKRLTIVDVAHCLPIRKTHEPAPWSILTRLLHQLDANSRAVDHFQQTVEAVREATGVEVVCWHNEATGDHLPALADPTLAGEGYGAFVQKLLGAHHHSNKQSFLWSQPTGGAARSTGTPHSAAAVRLCPARPGWIVALSLSPRRPLDDADVRLIGLAATMLLKQNQHARTYTQLKESLFGLVRCLTLIIEAKDSCTAGHSERVSRIAVRLGEEMGLPKPVISDLHLAGLLHDVGKVGIRDAVLLNPGKLSPEDAEHIREHVTIGDQIVSEIKLFAGLRPGVRNHHEHFDGSGYPDGLAGHAIPLIARILAVADSCDAMLSSRRYRGPMTPSQIDGIFLKYAGKQWDPEIVQHFMACRDDIYPPIYRKGIGDLAHFAIDDLIDKEKDGSSYAYPEAELRKKEVC
jgi:HD-GYP domain-containing protein (c-di-GMP phosphodiesterase class II)